MSLSPEPSPNYEEQFAHRFTADDKQYQQYLQRSSDPPPMVEDWIRGGGHQRCRDNRGVEDDDEEHEEDKLNSLKLYSRGILWDVVSELCRLAPDKRLPGASPIQGRDRDRGRGWGWSGEQRNSSHWQDRRWGSGGGGYEQGYNSYNQRPHNY